MGNMTLDTFIKANIANLRQNNSDFTLIESTPTTLSGVPAHQIVFSTNQKKALIVATLRNNIFYWLIYRSEPVSYVKFVSSAEQMISSFEFLG
jgi:hypothetical protein